MPNDTYNVLYLEDTKDNITLKEAIYDYLSFIHDEKTNTVETNLDFDKIIKMPDDLKNLPARLGSVGEEELREKYRQNAEKYGYSNWYEWAVANWGTKWNSYDGHLIDTSLSFYTAWSPPLPVIKELSKLTGKVFVLDYVDKGGAYIGKYISGPDGDFDECFDNFSEAPQSWKEALGVDDLDYMEED